MIRIIGALLVAAALATSAGAQPSGPGPVPNPWIISGNQVSLPTGRCVTMPQGVTGGCVVPNSINVSGGYYFNGALIGQPGGSSGNVQTNNGSGGFAGITDTALTAKINLATAALSGAAPAFPNNTTTFLRGDGSYAQVGNAALVNSTITVGSTSIALGATATTISGLTLASPTFSGTVAGANTIPYSILAQATGGLSVLGVTGNATANIAAIQGTASQFLGVNAGGTALAFQTMGGDATLSGATLTLATVNSNVGSFGSSTAIPSFTVNGKGLITAASTNAVIAPAGTLTGTTLAANVVTSSITTVGTLTGGATGAGFTVALGTSTLTGRVAFANIPQGGAFTFIGNTTGSTADVAAFTIAGLTNKAAPTGSDLLILSDAAASGATKYCTITQCLGAVTSGVSSLNALTGGLTIANGNGIAAISAVTTTITISADIASAAQFYGGTANKLIDASVLYTAVPAPAFSATPTFDFNTSASFNPGVMTANITSMTCNNLKPNQAGFIKFTQDGVGGRTTVYCSAMKFTGGVAPTLSTAASAVDILNYICLSSTVCYASLFKNPS